MLRKLLESSRYVVVIAVLGCFIAALALLVLGAYETAMILAKAFGGANDLKTVSLKFIEVVDAFLLATVFLITAIGLYELFIDAEIDVPEWLRITSLDELKLKLVSVVIIVLGVSFLGVAASWKGGTEILYLGVGMGAVIVALTYFLSNKK